MSHARPGATAEASVGWRRRQISEREPREPSPGADHQRFFEFGQRDGRVRGAVAERALLHLEPRPKRRERRPCSASNSGYLQACRAVRVIFSDPCWSAVSAERGSLESSALLDQRHGPLSDIGSDHFPMTTKSQGWADLYAWQLDRSSRTPLSRQVYMQVCSAVLSGALRAGARVPSSRTMASRLGVARASVVSAYEQLLAEGYVESRRGSGTFISGEVVGLAMARRTAPRAIKRAAVPTSARDFPDFERSAVQGEARPFNTGRTLVDARTAETWRRLTHRAVRGLGPNDLGYTDPAGLAELRRQYLRLSQGGARGPLRAGSDRHYGRHPTGDRHCDPGVACAGRRGLGRGSWLSSDPCAAVARQSAAARDSGRRPGSGRRRGPAHVAKGARNLRHALPPVSDWRRDVDGTAPGAVGLGSTERGIHRRG